MAEDRELAARVRDAMRDVPDVVERRMFGSLGFLVSGTLRLAVGAHPGRVAMVRTGAAQAAVLGRPGVSRAVMRGRPMNGWVFLDREAIDSDEQIAFWIWTGLDAI